MGSIAENIAEIRKEISAIAEKAGRNPHEITLIAVSKTKPVTDIQEAIETGQVHFGENRPRELRDKEAVLKGPKWHMIGRLQRNKVKYIAPFVHLIHSIDSTDLLEEVAKEASKNNRVIDCLIQMNISEEPQKGGIEPGDIQAIFSYAASLPHIRITGLMGMAEFTEDESVIRTQFKKLKRLFDEYSALQLPQNIHMQEISMGMTGDFHIAIEEGATMVRIGSAIFGGR